MPNYAMLLALLCKLTDLSEAQARELADKFTKGVSPTDFKMALALVEQAFKDTK